MLCKTFYLDLDYNYINTAVIKFHVRKNTGMNYSVRIRNNFLNSLKCGLH